MSATDEETPLLATDTSLHSSMSDDRPYGDQTADSAMETKQVSPPGLDIWEKISKGIKEHLTDRVENVLYIGEEALSDDWGANLLSAARVYKTFLKDLPDKLPTTAEARQTEQESMDNSFLKLGSSIITGLAELRTSLDENDRTTMANTLHGNFCEAHEFHMGFKDARKSAAESRSIGTALKQACFDRMYSDTRLPKSSLHIMAEENWRGNGSKPSANSIAWVFSAAKSDNTPKSIMDTIKMKELWKADMGSGESLDPV